MSRPSNSSSRLLRLPVPIREKIYLASGVPVDKVIHLVPWSRVEPREQTGSLTLEEVRVTHGLLLTCSEITAEVKSMLWRNNHFTVGDPHLEYGFGYLLASSPRDILELKRLSIWLRRWPTINPYWTGNEGSYLTSKLSSLWTSAITHILTNVQNRQLRLDLVCENAREEEQKIILGPLYAFRGTLKDLALALWGDASASSRALARQIVLKILAYSSSHQVTPTKQVEWNHESGFYSPMKWKRFRRTTNWAAHNVQQRTNPTVILQCQPRGDCPQYLSGHSSACRCWRPPTPLMVVSKAFYQSAMAVFYGKNRIMISPLDRKGSFPMHSGNVPFVTDVTRLAPAIFIKQHSHPEVLGHLRDIELLFPCVDMNDICDMEIEKYTGLPELREDWRTAVELLAKHANLASLQVATYISTSCLQVFGEALLKTGGDRSSLLARHKLILAPLSQLSGMARLFVHLEWPWYWSPRGGLWPMEARFWQENTESRYGEDIYPAPRIDRFEEWLERYIMGGCYDAASLGKYDQQPSAWLEDEFWWDLFERFCEEDIVRTAEDHDAIMYPEGI